MFPAGSIWKLYDVLVEIAFVGLPVVELAEVQRHALLQRNSLQSRNTRATQRQRRQCSNSYSGPPLARLQPDMVACKISNGELFLCKKSSCHSGSENDTPTTRAKLLDDFVFTDCTRYPNASETDVKTGLRAHPTQYCNQEDARFLWVFGRDNANDKESRLYKCNFNEVSRTNLQRIWCDDCFDPGPKKQNIDFCSPIGPRRPPIHGSNKNG
ncbi:hypothetical protein PTTG_25312 [Puccinia triticina 1-1 BBBD Race 1]|uniref:Uncharacterized protein n=1 Tax=Puccinia triticina (isolate 1-1 / race 1 (BBBD)) TaxID=630390 RepID=A0A180H5P4_PUCT1|nr:hypothetical protein PTTG_25312 [Puccinia triticina 1-1 BBBD Race 1]